MMIPRRPFRFSLQSDGAKTSQEWINKVCRAEDLGYDSILFPDHVHNVMSPIAAITAGAARTRRLRFGSYMFGNDFRHPLLLAQETATVDVLSDGRLDLGLGTGYLHYDYKQLGVPLDSPATRIERLGEAIQIIKKYFAGDPFQYEGKYYRVDAISISPAPVQKPHPPILMGGGGRRMISLAAREADIVGFNPRTTREGWFDFSSVSPEATSEKLQWFIQAAGDRVSEIELSLLVPLIKITDGESEALQVLEQFLHDFSVPEGLLTAEEVRESPHVFVGSLSAVQEKFLANREQFGISHFVFLNPWRLAAKLSCAWLGPKVGRSTAVWTYPDR